MHLSKEKFSTFLCSLTVWFQVSCVHHPNSNLQKSKLVTLTKSKPKTVVTATISNKVPKEPIELTLLSRDTSVHWYPYAIGSEFLRFHTNQQGKILIVQAGCNPKESEDCTSKLILIPLENGDFPKSWIPNTTFMQGFKCSGTRVLPGDIRSFALLLTGCGWSHLEVFPYYFSKIGGLKPLALEFPLEPENKMIPFRIKGAFWTKTKHLALLMHGFEDHFPDYSVTTNPFLRMFFYSIKSDKITFPPKNSESYFPDVRRYDLSFQKSLGELSLQSRGYFKRSDGSLVLLNRYFDLGAEHSLVWLQILYTWHKQPREIIQRLNGMLQRSTNQPSQITEWHDQLVIGSTFFDNDSAHKSKPLVMMFESGQMKDISIPANGDLLTIHGNKTNLWAITTTESSDEVMHFWNYRKKWVLEATLNLPPSLDIYRTPTNEEDRILKGVSHNNLWIQYPHHLIHYLYKEKKWVEVPVLSPVLGKNDTINILDLIVVNEKEVLIHVEQEQPSTTGKKKVSFWFSTVKPKKVLTSANLNDYLNKANRKKLDRSRYDPGGFQEMPTRHNHLFPFIFLLLASCSVKKEVLHQKPLPHQSPPIAIVKRIPTESHQRQRLGPVPLYEYAKDSTLQTILHSHGHFAWLLTKPCSIENASSTKPEVKLRPCSNERYVIPFQPESGTTEHTGFLTYKPFCQSPQMLAVGKVPLAIVEQNCKHARGNTRKIHLHSPKSKLTPFAMDFPWGENNKYIDTLIDGVVPWGNQSLLVAAHLVDSPKLGWFHPMPKLFLYDINRGSFSDVRLSQGLPPPSLDSYDLRVKKSPQKGVLKLQERISSLFENGDLSMVSTYDLFTQSMQPSRFIQLIVSHQQNVSEKLFPINVPEEFSLFPHIQATNFQDKVFFWGNISTIKDSEVRKPWIQQWTSKGYQDISIPSEELLVEIHGNSKELWAVTYAESKEQVSIWVFEKSWRLDTTIPCTLDESFLRSRERHSLLHGVNVRNLWFLASPDVYHRLDDQKKWVKLNIAQAAGFADQEAEVTVKQIVSLDKNRVALEVQSLQENGRTKENELARIWLTSWKPKTTLQGDILKQVQQ
jgi:hypothetical protein